MKLGADPNYTDYEESKKIGKVEDTDFYWISNAEERLRIFCANIKKIYSVCKIKNP